LTSDNYFGIIMTRKENDSVFQVRFFKNRQGEQPVKQMLLELKARIATDKDARINFVKIIDYIRVLHQRGTAAGQPYIKHLDGEIWELRPLRNRILFAAVHENTFYLLHHFVKKTQKTPPKEIEQAKREYLYLMESEEMNNEQKSNR